MTFFHLVSHSPHQNTPKSCTGFMLAISIFQTNGNTCFLSKPPPTTIIHFQPSSTPSNVRWLSLGPSFLSALLSRSSYQVSVNFHTGTLKLPLS